MLGKAKSRKFPTNTHSNNAILDYVHANIWGPSRTKSHGRAMHFLSLVDEFSIKVWVCFLKHKNEDVKCLKNGNFLLKLK